MQVIVAGLGLPAFTARQLCEWLYRRGTETFDGMTNLSKRARRLLDAQYLTGLTGFSNVQTSADGTRKYLFPAGCGRFIESACIPDRRRMTLCVSSQAGCKMGCVFCMTGRQGFQGQLGAGDIVNQVCSLPQREALTNIVYMGMGEPLDNLDNVLRSLEILTADWGFGMSPRRITVSTIGILPAMETFLAQCTCHLAVSMHTPFHDERRQLMPVENVYPIEAVVDHLRGYDWNGQRRVSFEYILFKGVNDSPRHVQALVHLLDGLRCRINLIRFHPIPGTPLECPPEATVQAFREALVLKGIRTTIRASRGQDIAAACGLLSTLELVKMQAPDF